MRSRRRRAGYGDVLRIVVVVALVVGLLVILMAWLSTL